MSALTPVERDAVDRAYTLARRIRALSTATTLVLTGAGLPQGSPEQQEVAEYLLDIIADLSEDASLMLGT